MTQAAFKLVVDICSAATFVLLLFCLYRIPQRTPEVRFIAINLFWSLAIVILIEVWGPQGKVINIPQNLSITPMFVFILLVYDVAWRRRYRALTIVSLISVVGFGAWNMLYGQGDDFNSYTLAFGGLTVIVHGVLYLYDLLVRLPVEKLHRLPMFWFNAAYLTYFASSTFIFAAYIVDVFRNSLLLYWTIQNILRLTQFILIGVGLWQDLRNIRLRSSFPSAR